MPLKITLIVLNDSLGIFWTILQVSQLLLTSIVACNGGSCEEISLKIFACEKIARMNVDCKLVPVQYREYEYFLLEYRQNRLSRLQCVHNLKQGIKQKVDVCSSKLISTRIY